jgi:transcriptional regulator with XRE-family HTH domain
MVYDFGVLRELRKRRNLTISKLSELCNVSYVALSKLERNQGNPELKTLDRISHAMDMPTHNLLALAEQQRPVQTREKTSKVLGKADCRHVTIDGTRILCIRAPRGASGDAAEFHAGDHEQCFVLEGKLKVTVGGNSYVLDAGEAMGWDCQLDHNLEVVEPATFISVHTAKHL